jgi:AraC family transcriptional regulator of adaptative response / DNA-3-methyladenine glycosylase II
VHLDPEICYRALRTRDARFDGRFFTAVRTTRIYCRPVCPRARRGARTAGSSRARAAAEAAGYRPCRRCRPESAPGTPAWLGTSATVSRGLRLIGEGALDAETSASSPRGSESASASCAGCSLSTSAPRRSRSRARGARTSPRSCSHRLHGRSRASRSRRLHEPATVQRSDARDVPPLTARDARGAPRPGGDASGAIRLPYRAPFDGAGHARLSRRARRARCRVVSERGGAARTAGRRSADRRRSDRARRKRAAVEVRAIGAEARTGSRSRIACAPCSTSAPTRARSRASSATIRGCAKRCASRPGVRVPGAWDPFEIAVRIVLGQQVTVAGATQLAGRLATRFGEPLPDALCDTGDPGPDPLFPSPTRSPTPRSSRSDSRASARARCARWPRAVARGDLALAPGADPDAVRAALIALPGIGPWTAELVLLRALGEPDAFPAGDLGLPARTRARRAHGRAARGALASVARLRRDAPVVPLRAAPIDRAPARARISRSSSAAAVSARSSAARGHR